MCAACAQKRAIAREIRAAFAEVRTSLVQARAFECDGWFAGALTIRLGALTLFESTRELGRLRGRIAHECASFECERSDGLRRDPRPSRQESTRRPTTRAPDSKG